MDLAELKCFGERQVFLTEESTLQSLVTDPTY